MAMETMTRRTLVVLGTASVLATGLLPHTRHPRTVEVATSEAIDLSTPVTAASWADDVFVGRVEDVGKSTVPKGANPRLELPMTVYRVRVLRSLKGRAHGQVHVAIPGGLTPDRSERVVVPGVQPLTKAGVYVLATRVTGHGWHTSPSADTAVPLASEQDVVLQTWEKAVRDHDAAMDAYPSDASGMDEAERAKAYEGASS